MHRGQKITFSKALYGLLPVVTNGGAGIRKTQANVMMKKEEWRLKEKWFESSTHTTVWRIIYEACVMKMIMCSVTSFQIIRLWSWKLFLVAEALYLVRVLPHFLRFQSRIFSCCLLWDAVSPGLRRHWCCGVLMWQVRSSDCSQHAAGWTAPAQPQRRGELAGLLWMDTQAERKGEEGLGPVRNHLEHPAQSCCWETWQILVENCKAGLLSYFPNSFTLTDPLCSASCRKESEVDTGSIQEV